MERLRRNLGNRRVLHSFLVAAACANWLCGCGPHVEVKEHPLELTVERGPVMVDLGHGHKADAITNWFFHCRPKVDLDVRVEDTGGKPLVIATVRGAKLEIGLTVKQRLPESAKPELIAHEGGHLQICRAVYADAPEAARLACQKMIGRQIEAEGVTRPIAIKVAYEAASRQLCRTYLELTSSRVDSISSYYDKLTDSPGGRISPDQAVQQALISLGSHPSKPVTIK